MGSIEDQELKIIQIILLGICFFSGVPEDVVEEIAEGEKGG